MYTGGGVEAPLYYAGKGVISWVGEYMVEDVDMLRVRKS
jgi:hypothetical protein